jgi:uncharacterized protein (TIGR02118 family)
MLSRAIELPAFDGLAISAFEPVGREESRAREDIMTDTKDIEHSTVEFPRRTALALGLAAAAGLVAGSESRAAGGGLKVTVLYNAPKDPAAFEKHYAETHMPMVYAEKGIQKIELALGVPGPGGPPPFYRITELWFESAEKMKEVTSTPSWKKIVDDVPNFATGGAIVLIAKVE